MRRGVASTLVVVALGLMACSGDDDGGAPPPTDPPAAPTTTPAPTTAPTTTTPTTTAATTTTPTTTPTTPTTTTTTSVAAPPPTDPPEPTVADLEAEVAAAYDRIYDGYWACLRAPLDCDTSWLVEGSGSAEAMQATMQGLADRDRYVGDDPVGYYVIEDIELNADGTEATVVSCWSLTAVLYTTPPDPTRPTGPDNPPTVVNDTPGSLRQRDVLERQSDSWAVSSSQGLEEIAQEDLCSG